MEASLPQLIVLIKLERSSERPTSLGGLVVLEELGLRAVPDAMTIGDWLRRQGLAGAAGIQQVSRELGAGSLREEPEELIPDVNATEIEADRQEAEWAYHQVKGYMPRVGYVNGVCVGHEFREGKQSPGAGILSFAQSCEAALPEGKRINFRSDSAAYQAEVINHYS